MTLARSMAKAMARSMAFPLIGRWPAVLGETDIDRFVDGDLQRFYFDFDGLASRMSTAVLIDFRNDLGEAYKMETSFVLDATSASNQFIMAASNNGIQIGVNSSEQIFVKVGGSAQIAYTAVNVVVGVPYSLTIEAAAWDTGSADPSVVATMTNLNDSTDVQTETNIIASAEVRTFATWSIGAIAVPAFWFSGKIWDVGITLNGAGSYNHFWALDEGNFTTAETSIVDSGTGIATGTLTLGAGTWSNISVTVGDGLTEDTAWSNLQEIQSLWGTSGTALHDLTIGVKRGTTVRDSLATFGVQGFTLRDYGSGAKPIIQRSQELDASDFTDLTGGHYTVASIDGTNPMSVVVDGTWFTPQPTQAAAADLGNENNKLWSDGAGTIHLYSSTVDPTAATTIETARIDSDIATLDFSSLGGGSPRNTENLSLLNLDVRHGKNCLQFAGWSGLTLTGTTAQWCFSPTTSTSIGFWFQGAGGSLTSSDGLVVSGCTVTDTDSHSMALRDIADAAFTDTDLIRAGDHSIEILGAESNVTFNRCKLHNPAKSSASGILAFKNTASAEHGQFKFINCEFWGPYNDHQQVKNGGTNNAQLGQRSFISEISTSTKIAIKAVNCTFYCENLPITYDLDVTGAQVIDIRLVNCLVLKEERTAADFTGGSWGSLYTWDSTNYMESSDTGFSDWGAAVITDNNCYHQYTAVGRMFTVATVAKTFATWKSSYSGTYELDGNSVVTLTDPVTERDRDKAGTLDLSLVAGSAAIGVGSFLDAAGATDPDVPTVDIDGNPRSGSNDAGCYQYAA